jgi:hypothetical protein
MHKRSENSHWPLKLKGGKKASEEERVIVETLNHFAAQGLIPDGALPWLRDYGYQQVESMKAATSQPVFPSPLDAFDQLRAATDQTKSTTFVPVAGRYLLLDSDNGTILANTTVASSTFEEFIGSTGVQIELLAELIGLALSLVFRIPGSAKQKIKDKAAEIAGDDRVRRILAKLLEIIRDYQPTAQWREKLRKILKDFFDAIKDSLKELVDDIIDGMSWWEIAVGILSLLLAFTPIGWAKRGGEFFVGMTALTGSLWSKWEAAQAAVDA